MRKPQQCTLFKAITMLSDWQYFVKYILHIHIEVEEYSGILILLYIWNILHIRIEVEEYFRILILLYIWNIPHIQSSHSIVMTLNNITHMNIEIWLLITSYVVISWKWTLVETARFYIEWSKNLVTIWMQMQSITWRHWAVFLNAVSRICSHHLCTWFMNYAAHN